MPFSRFLPLSGIPPCLLLLLLLAGCGGPKATIQAPEPRPAPPARPGAQRPAEPPRRQPPATQPPAAPLPEVTTIAPPTEEAAPGPLIRIGLETGARELRISSSAEFHLMEKTPDAPRWRIGSEVRIRAEGGGAPAAAAYQIQVASLSSPDRAAELGALLERELEVPVAVQVNASTGAHRVRVGLFAGREEARELLEHLVRSGYPDAFLTRAEPSGGGTAGGGGTELVVSSPDNLSLRSLAGFFITPSSGSDFLSVDGKPYRGALDVIPEGGGRMTLVNQLGLEEYLFGVVPAEMNPATYPEPAALAAQAVAARTYALKNMGRYRSQGFDLTDDTRTQVYGGVNGEREMTSDIVRETAGIAIYHQDGLIDAMFMSTCGGRTEDASLVYGSAPVPYLKSVACAVESGPGPGEIVLEGRHGLEEPFLADDGHLANRNLELARILGIGPSDREARSPGYFTAPAERDDMREWIRQSVLTVGGSPPEEAPRGVDIATRGGFLLYAAESFFGPGTLSRRISTGDIDYYMANIKDGERVRDPLRAVLSHLMQSGLWRPNADNTVRPEDRLRRGDALSLLLRWIETARPGMLRKGVFTGLRREDGDGSVIGIRSGNRTHEFRLAPAPALFRMDQGQATPIHSIRMIGAEKIAFHLGPSDRIDFLEIELSPSGASSDRHSPAATWEALATRSAVGEKLRPLTGDIGTFLDLEPHRTGESGRVVEVRAVGSRRSVVLNGYKVRNALGLKDTLYTLGREYGADGRIQTFTFNGRGYGHGIGLCQTGAYGMARAGRSYEDILKTYYTGVDIRKAY
ncbi:MAG: SpoIID/LytB domain-containing protein [Acidobacteria bacterium]|nr:SpoIID/LytB domain-containing protein [Acidobacteriota bacterium]